MISLKNTISKFNPGTLEENPLNRKMIFMFIL